MGMGRGRVGDGLEIEEHGAGDARGLVFRAGVAALVGEVPRRVDDGEAGPAQARRQPVGGDQGACIPE
jgi:hypothetical protein